ncbi:hypothetical protein M407DRAFT_34420 [Tulasnella calospora MUT 4182]|uniref:Uncharacterized protein n=1 Tax=Tulasnella calospora MUT 4182 TaxID=1051891 RepID=A0A0C3PNF9_9AGAM|nr:hypothetical protein M407DRAFT_34420 [Tulasnella calospora MUT 4182]
MSFLWRAVSALRQAIRTLVSKTRRTAKAIVRGLSSAVQTTKEAIKKTWDDMTEVTEKAATASTKAVVEVANIITDTARKGHGVLRNTLRGVQKIIIYTTHKAVKTVRAAWNWWNTKVPRWVRLTVYGVVIGASFALVLYHVLGFGHAGIIADTPAAMHSSIGNVAAGTTSGFTTMKSLGATLGFGPAGIIAGTPAAAIHSYIGNVVAGTWFATMQSLGATGKLAWIMPTVGGGIGALLAHFLSFTS